MALKDLYEALPGCQPSLQAQEASSPPSTLWLSYSSHNHTLCTFPPHNFALVLPLPFPIFLP